MTITALPKSWEPMVEAVAVAAALLPNAAHFGQGNLPRLVAVKFANTAILAFLNAAIEAGVARKANALDFDTGEGKTWWLADELLSANEDLFPAIILNMGDAK